MFSLQDAIKKAGINDKERKKALEDTPMKVRKLLGKFVPSKVLTREAKESELKSIQVKIPNSNQPDENELEKTTFSSINPQKYDIKTSSKNFLVQQIAKSLNEKNRNFLLSIENKRTNESVRNEIDGQNQNLIKEVPIEHIVSTLNDIGGLFNNKYGGNLISNLGYRMRFILTQMYTESQLRSIANNSQFISAIVQKHFDMIKKENENVIEGENDAQREARISQSINGSLQILASELSSAISRGVVQASGATNGQKPLLGQNLLGWKPDFVYTIDKKTLEDDIYDLNLKNKREKRADHNVEYIPNSDIPIEPELGVGGGEEPGLEVGGEGEPELGVGGEEKTPIIETKRGKGLFKPVWSGMVDNNYGQGFDNPTTELEAISGKSKKGRVIPLLSHISKQKLQTQPIHSGFYKPPKKVGKGFKPITTEKPSMKVLKGAKLAGSDNPFLKKLIEMKKI